MPSAVAADGARRSSKADPLVRPCRLPPAHPVQTRHAPFPTARYAAARDSTLAFGHSLELLAERLLDFVGHRHPVNRNQRLQRERAQLVERGADLGPALLRVAVLFEGLPDVLEEELDEFVRDRSAAAR